MTGLAAGFVLASFGAGLVLIRPAVSRTGLSAWHPALAWLALEFLFFGVGSAVLAIVDQRAGAAAYVGGAVLAFTLGVAASDRLAHARSRVGQPEPSADGTPPTAPGAEAARLRPWAVLLLIGMGLAVLLPTLLTVGIPFLSGDVTAARSEVGGLDLQVLRVALPAAAVAAALHAAAGGSTRLRVATISAVGLIGIAELLMASRYLAAELAAALVIGLGLGRRPMSGRLLAAAITLAVTLFVIVGILRAYDQAAGREVDFALGRTVNRVLLVQPRTLDALQTVIPAERPHFDGRTWLRRLGPSLGQDDIPNLGYWIYPRLFPDQTIPGYAATGLVGEAWANFGWLGLTMFAVLGALVERLGAWLAVRRTTVADVVTGALLTLFIARTHALGLNGLVVLVALVVGWRLIVASPARLGHDARAVLSWRL